MPKYSSLGSQPAPDIFFLANSFAKGKMFLNFEVIKKGLFTFQAETSTIKTRLFYGFQWSRTILWSEIIVQGLRCHWKMSSIFFVIVSHNLMTKSVATFWGPTYCQNRKQSSAYVTPTSLAASIVYTVPQFISIEDAGLANFRCLYRPKYRPQGIGHKEYLHIFTNFHPYTELTLKQ